MKVRTIKKSVRGDERIFSDATDGFSIKCAFEKDVICSPDCASCCMEEMANPTKDEPEYRPFIGAECHRGKMCIGEVIE